MTKEQKELLRLHADHFQAMASYVRECDPQELIELSEACDATSASNCGWDTYAAAQFLKDEISAHRLMLVRRGESSFPATESDAK